MAEKVKCGKVLSGLAPQPADSYFTITESSLPRQGVSGMPPPGKESYIGSILNQFNTPHCEVKKHCLGDYITDPVIRQTCPLGAAGNPIVTPSQLRPSWSAAQKPVTLKLSVIKANISESGEPIFLDIVLYDIKKKRRISESFYAECNSQSSMQCSGLSELDMFSASKAKIKDGIFMLPEIGETNYQDFRFFIRGYRVFIGDNDKDSSHYKKDSLSNDDHDQFFKLIKQQCSRYQSDPVPLQPYFFDTFPAYTARDQINSKVNLKGSYFAKSSITDEFALELITDSRKEKTKGLKTLPTTITIVLDKAKPSGVVLDPSMNLISSSSLPLRPGEDVAKEVACFDSTIVQEPRCVAYNDLFVYPTSLSLKDKAGNYSVIFEVININTPHYDNVSCGYLPAFGYRCPDISNGKESKNYALGCKVATSVQYKDDNPRFGEELKFRIPADFKNYCLVMSVQNVTVDSEKKQPNFFAALNLADDERFTCEKSYSLKLFESRDEAIKSAGSGRQEKKKRSITIQVHLESNIIPSNYSLGSFFLSWDEVSATVDYSKLNRIFDSTDSAVVFADVIKFFPFIMHLYQKSFVQVGKGSSALENLFRLLKTVPSIMQDSLTASQFSAALVRYLDTFNPQTYCDSEGNGVHVVVAALWAGSLGVNHAEASSQSFHCQYNWFVLRLILKSALFYAQRKGVLSEDFNRTQRFPPEFSRNVCAIISFCLMSAPESGCSSKDYEMFFETVNDCMEIIDRGLIADVLYRFIKSCTSPEKITNAELHTKVVQPLLSSFIQNPAFFQQNFPVAKPEEFFQGDFIEVCVANYMKAFPFVGVLLYYIERTFTTSTYQPIALRILKSLLRVSYFDSRFQDPSVRRSIVSMFLPFITMAVFNETARDELDPNKSMPNFLACFVYIVENLSEELLLRWWDHIIPCARIAFIKTLNTYCDQIDNTVDDDKTRQDSAELCVPSRVFELLRSIIEHRLQDIKSCPDLFKEIMQLVLKIYGQAELDHLHALIFPVINLILERLRTEFFSDGEVFQKLVKQLLCLMNAGEEASRVSAINVFISIIKRPDDGQAQADNVNTAIISACIALFKEILVETKDLRTSLKIVVDEINSSPDMFFPGASETMQKVSNLISYYEHIASAKSVDTFIQLSYNFLKQFVTSVSMLTTMLDSILSKLMSAQFFEEAAECQLHLAYAYSCLLRPSECSIKPKIDLTGLVPNLKLKEFDPDSLTGQKNCTYKLSDIIKCIDDAKCKFLTAKMYESAMRASLLASQLYLESENYFLLHISAESSCVTANDLKIQASSLRIFPKYYRVCYEAGDAYTTNFPEICGKGYIYKMDPESNLGTFKAYIKNFLLEIVPDERLLNFVTNNEKIKRPAEPDKINYQVASVEPYFTDEELATERKTIFSQNFNIRKFILSQALGTAEKAIVNNIAEQKKKKTIFTTEHAFPFIMRRIEIIKQEEFILSPIENAIEQINERSAALQKQLHSDPPKINQLQQVLQGIVLPMVNEGPMKICEVFLGNKTPNDESQKSLSDSIRVLFDLCGTALQKDAEFSGDSKLHKTLQTSYEYPQIVFYVIYSIFCVYTCACTYG